jgi:hypothetical protein
MFVIVWYHKGDWSSTVCRTRWSWHYHWHITIGSVLPSQWPRRKTRFDFQKQNTGHIISNSCVPVLPVLGWQKKCVIRLVQCATCCLHAIHFFRLYHSPCPRIASQCFGNNLLYMKRFDSKLDNGWGSCGWIGGRSVSVDCSVMICAHALAQMTVYRSRSGTYMDLTLAGCARCCPRHSKLWILHIRWGRQRGSKLRYRAELYPPKPTENQNRRLQAWDTFGRWIEFHSSCRGLMHHCEY